MRSGTVLAAVVAQSGLYENPSGTTYLIAGYGLCVAGIVVYTATLLIRGRRLSRRVPPEQRRWSS